VTYKKIISIHGGPRNGTSWLGQLFDSSPEVKHKWQPLFSDSFKDRVPFLKSKKDFKEYYDDLYLFDDEFLDRTKQQASGSYPIFPIKSSNPEVLVTKHTRYHYLIQRQLELLTNIKFVAIVRNPCGTLNSFRKAPREFDPKWNFEHEWRFAQSKNLFMPENYFGFHRWKEYAKLFMEMEKLYPHSFILISYEELVNNTVELVQKLFDFCKIELSEQTESFIHDSKSIQNNDTYSVFKKNKDINDWKNELPAHIIEEVYLELKNTEFERFII